MQDLTLEVTENVTEATTIRFTSEAYITVKSTDGNLINTVIIPAGQKSVKFKMEIADNGVKEATRMARIAAIVTRKNKVYETVNGRIAIFDND